MPPLLGPGDRCHVYDIVAFLGTSGAAELYLVRGPSGDLCLLKLMAAPAPTASATTPRSPAADPPKAGGALPAAASKRPGTPAPRKPGLTPHPKN